eukprot:5671397-Pyramimonas_sp.AAC.1
MYSPAFAQLGRYLKGRVASVCEWGRAVPPEEVREIATTTNPWGYRWSWATSQILTYFNMEEGAGGGLFLKDSFQPEKYVAYAMPRRT